MSQSRIHSFFSAVPDLVYESQLERDRQQHSVDRESAQVEQAVRRLHTRQQQEPEVAEEVGTDSEGEEVPHVAVDYDAV